jgi:hypothetical protein
MSEWVWVVIAVAVVVVVLAIVGLVVSRRRRSARLKEHFGPEYDRTVDELGEPRAAEAELAAREKKRKKLNIVELTPEARREHAELWQRVQTDFVDDPKDAVGRAERLVTRVMRERGYPIDDFDHRAADISVDHPDIVENYRSAHAIYQSQHNGDISTEDARQAFVHYRALFDRLLGSDGDGETHDAGEPRVQTAHGQSAEAQNAQAQQVSNGDYRRQTHDHA